MRFNTLISRGAQVTKPFSFYKVRPKVSGWMWEGNCVLKLDDTEFYFQLWYHGGDEMSEEQAKEHISLKGVRYQGKYYDLYWYAVMTEDAIWLHPKGWFKNRALENEPIIAKRRNCNFGRDQLTSKDEEALAKLGFFKLAI